DLPWPQRTGRIIPWSRRSKTLKSGKEIKPVPRQARGGPQQDRWREFPQTPASPATRCEAADRFVASILHSIYDDCRSVSPASVQVKDESAARHWFAGNERLRRGQGIAGPARKRGAGFGGGDRLRTGRRPP